MTTKRIIVGITGASGAAYAQRMIRAMLDAGVEVHLVISPLGQRLLHDELGMEGVNLETLTGGKSTDGHVPGVTLYNYRDVGAAIASGSFKTDGMIIVPCSSNSLAAVANGNQNNLLHRAAHVVLKERRRLVLVHREMPLSLVDIRNMGLATEAGAIICPANPGFYLLPRTLDDIIDFVAARLLDLFDIDHNLSHRWGEREEDTTTETRRHGEIQ
jgi:polyprenyl P-hydroxybenzoate/phenylacrylic acid decarboxylase-like protein